MTDENRRTTDAPQGQSEEAEPLPAFLGKLAHGGASETWVRAAVLDADGAGGRDAMRYQLGDPLLERRGDTIWVEFPLAAMDALSRRHSTSEPWRLLTGHDIDVLLRTGPGHERRRVELVDVGPAWLDHWFASARRERLSVLAGLGAVCSQRGLQVLHPVRVVDVLRPAEAPSPDVDARLASLVAAGVVVREVLRLGRAGSGRAVAEYMRLRLTGGSSRPDAVLMLAGGTAPPEFVDDIEVALFASEVRVPIVLGAPQRRGGSLLHELAFRSSDAPMPAVAALEGIVDDGARAEARARRVREYVLRTGRDGRA